MDSRTGGWSETKPATEETQKISDEVKLQVEKITGKNYKEFKAAVYRDQIVSGINFLIKVYVAEDQYPHVQVYENISMKLEVIGVEEHHTRDDPLEPIKPINQ